MPDTRATLKDASPWASHVIPKCSAEGCHLWVWNEAPQHVENRRGLLTVVIDGLPVPKSDKCWYHHNGKTPPPEAR